jgi:hypothetical protein
MADMGPSLLLDAYPLAVTTPERLPAAWLVKALSIPGLIITPYPKMMKYFLSARVSIMTTTTFWARYGVEYFRKEMQVETGWEQGANLRGRRLKLA